MKASSFIKVALGDYKVGALTKSSTYVAKKVASVCGPEYKYIVEYGAGDGVITKELLKNLPPDGKIIAIELNGELVSELKKINDSRLVVINDTVVTRSQTLQNVGLPRIDLVVSGIPFSFFKPATREEIIRGTHEGLRDEGIFLVYQYSLLVRSHLKKYFKETRVSFEARNFPPYFIMQAKK